MKNNPEYKVVFDISTVKALQADLKEKVEIAKEFWGMGVPFDIINEKLELGFPKFEGSNFGYLPYSLAPAGMLQDIHEDDNTSIQRGDSPVRPDSTSTPYIKPEYNKDRVYYA